MPSRECRRSRYQPGQDRPSEMNQTKDGNLIEVITKRTFVYRLTQPDPPRIVSLTGHASPAQTPPSAPTFTASHTINLLPPNTL